MKRKIITFALFAGLSMLAIGCQKETFAEHDAEVETTHEYISVNYSIDGVTRLGSFEQ